MTSKPPERYHASEIRNNPDLQRRIMEGANGSAKWKRGTGVHAPPPPKLRRGPNATAAPAYDCYVGIDPGTNTGVAVVDHRLGHDMQLHTLTFWACTELLAALGLQHGSRLLVVIEDPTQKKVMFARYDDKKKKGPAYYARIAQSVGENMAQAKLLLEFCRLKGIPTEAVPPLGKIEQPEFAALTGIEHGSQHARDAARLILGR